MGTRAHTSCFVRATSAEKKIKLRFFAPPFGFSIGTSLRFDALTTDRKELNKTRGIQRFAGR